MLKVHCRTGLIPELPWDMPGARLRRKVDAHTSVIGKCRPSPLLCAV